MTLPDPSHPQRTPAWTGSAEWLLVGALAVVLVGTTLALGGYLAETMIVVSWSIFGIALLGIGLGWVRAWRGEASLHLAALLPLPFLAYALSSVIWLAPAGWLAWREWLLWLQTAVVFVLVLHFGRSRTQTRLLLGTIVGLALLGTGMAIYQRFVDGNWLMLGRSQADQFIGRSSGMFGIPNSLAGLLELVLPGCLVLAFARDQRAGVRLGCALMAALLLVGIVLTGSRGGWISVALVLMLWPLLVGRAWKRKVFGTSTVFLLTGVSLWALYRGSSYAHERIQPFLEGKFETTRPLIWKAGWQMWQEAPWLGRGAAAYNVLFEQYRPRGFLNEPHWTHNDYLNTLVDYGVVGCGLWIGCGLVLAMMGWISWRQGTRENGRPDERALGGPLQLGMLLGLLAFALHLGVDFHTKIPGLAFCAAALTALVVRDSSGWQRQVGRMEAWIVGLLLAVGVTLLAWRIADPLYRAEALRFEARRAVDRFAQTGEGNMESIARNSKRALTRAVRIDPSNGQAWADLAYLYVQNWRVPGADLVSLGRFAELAADEALQRCSVRAEFWVRRGVALEVQRGRPEAEACFRRALVLAPNSPEGWYYFAYHLHRQRQRRAEALAALETCLALDPYYLAADTLRQQLAANR